MMEKDFEKELGKRARKKKNGSIVVSFSISDCPLWLYKWFIDDSTRYNDVYWVRLKEIHDVLAMQQAFAEAPGQSESPREMSEEEKKKAKDSYLVNTFRDTEEVKVEQDEKVEGGK